MNCHAIGTGCVDPPARLRRFAWGVGLFIAFSAVSSAADEERSVSTGVRFRQELRRPINVFLRAVTVRTVTERLAAQHNVAIVLDRRIDPDHVLDVQLAQVTLREGLDLFAAQIAADAAVVGSTIVLGPPASLDRLRTDCVRQVEFLRSLKEDKSRERTFELIQSRTFRWDDLQTPQELLLTVSRTFGVTVVNPELIPHDRWAGGVMANVNAIEALALIAGQFDLTFSWSEDVSAIELKESPQRLTIEDSYDVPAGRDEPALAAAGQECPLAAIRRDGGKLHVVATVREHERIAAILAPESRGPQAAAPDLGPLSRRTFTLTIQRAPAAAVLRTLEAQGVVVEYDADALQSAGIDLTQKISLSLQDAPADRFFQALCDPLGLTFHIEGKTVRLIPPPPPPPPLPPP
ncbi:MAG: hypothetical protein AB7U20_17050 [Planctomycetaceae bacterium]